MTIAVVEKEEEEEQKLLLNFTEHLLYDIQYSKHLTTNNNGTHTYRALTMYVPSALNILT